jgi:hypothetical protein
MSSVDYKQLKGSYKKEWLDKLLHLKRWVFTSVYATTAEGKHLAVVDFIGDLGYGSAGFIAVYDLDAKTKIAGRNFTSIAGHGKVSAQPADGLDAKFAVKEATFTLVRPHGSNTYRHRATLTAGQGAPAIDLDAALNAADATPLTMIAPVGAHAVTMTQKSQAMSGTGTLKVGQVSYRLTEIHGAIDYTSGELRHHTKWLWASASGLLGDKRRFGLNLVSGFNENSLGASENGLWIGRDVIALPKVIFEHDHESPMKPWRVRNADPKARYTVDIHFKGVSQHENHSNLIVIRSDYVQPIGYWEGSIVDNQTGHRYEFNAVGLAEDQDVKW